MLATGVTSTKKNVVEATPSDEESRIMRQIEKLERQLADTQKQGDLYEESRLCNNIAIQYEAIFNWNKALHFHYFDKQISLANDDYDGALIAIGHLARIFSQYSNAFCGDCLY